MSGMYTQASAPGASGKFTNSEKLPSPRSGYGLRVILDLWSAPIQGITISESSHHGPIKQGQLHSLHSLHCIIQQKFTPQPSTSQAEQGESDAGSALPTDPLVQRCTCPPIKACFARLLLAPNPACFSCCSPIVPTFRVGHFVSAKLYCGIINQDSTRVICSNGRCYFTSNTLISAVQTDFRKLDWNSGIT